MRCKLICIILILISYRCFSGENIMSLFQLENQYVITSSSINPQNCIVKFANKSIYFIKSQIKSLNLNDTLYLFKKNTFEEKKYKILINMKDWIYDFAIYENVLILLGQNYLHKYIFNDKGFIFQKVIEIPGTSYKEICFYNKDKVILNRSCWSCEQRGSKIAICDISKGKFIFEKALPEPIGFPLTYYQPRRLISFSGKNFAVSDLTEYNINIYDLNLKPQYKLSRKVNNWTQQENLYDELSKLKSVSDIFKKSNHFNEINYKNSSIHLVDFIDDSTLLVCWSSDNSANINSTNMPIIFYYDVWRNKKNVEWFLYKKDMECVFFHTSEIFNFNEFNRLFTNYIISNNKLILPSTFPFMLNSFDLDNITFTELHKQETEYIKQNGLNKISFFIYKLKD